MKITTCSIALLALVYVGGEPCFCQSSAAEKEVMDWLLKIPGCTIDFEGSEAGKAITVVRFGPKCSDAELRVAVPRLRVLKRLECLVLSYSAVTDEGLMELKELNLAALYLANTSVGDRGVERLVELKTMGRLKEIHLGATKITDVGLKSLSKLRQLQTVHLGENRITDIGLKNLSLAKSLQTVSLAKTSITDSGLEHLAELQKLKCLDLSFTMVSGEGLKSLTSLKNLEELDLRGSLATALAGLAKRLQDGGIPLKAKKPASGLHHLAQLKKLKTLTLEESEITDEILGTLHDAGIMHCVCVAEGVSGRARGPGDVVRLSLARSLITDAGLRHLASFEALEHLDLSSTQVTDAGLKHLVGLKKLRFLALDRTKVQDKHLSDLAHLKKLRTLLLGHNPEVTSAGTKGLAALTELQTLDLQGTGVTDIGLRALTGLGNLKELNLLMTGVSDAAIEAFRTAVPGCKIINRSD